MTTDAPHSTSRADVLPVSDAPDVVTDAELARPLKEVPKGALAVCGIAVAILMACWLAIYFGIFLPRGPIS